MNEEKLPLVQSEPKESPEKKSVTDNDFIKQFLPPWWEFWKTLPIAWAYLRNTAVPGKAKTAYVLAGIAMLLYILFPIDVVPELFLPVIGYVDDLGTIPAFLAITNMFNNWCNKQLPSS